ncbi:hypothetical protein V866_004186 [Kwoniella sp. B9012]
MNNIGIVNSENTSAGASTVDVSSQSDLSRNDLDTALDSGATTPIHSTDQDAHGPTITVDEACEHYRRLRLEDPGFSAKFSTGDGCQLGDILDGVVYQAGDDYNLWRSTEKFDQDIHDAGGTIVLNGQKYEKTTLTNDKHDVSRLAYITRTGRKMIEDSSPKIWSTLSGYPINTLNEYHEFLRKKNVRAGTELWVHMTGWELEPAASHATEAGQAKIVDGPGTSA